MELNFHRADPAGNVTLIVSTPVASELRAELAARLMELPELGAEQVCYEVAPLHGGDGRIEMMGGEFCGNAARSFGFLLCERRGFGGEVRVEISGADSPLTVYCEPAAKKASVEMPLPLRICDFMGFPTAEYAGISHALVRGAPDRALAERLIASARRDTAWDAFGVMFAEGESLVPVVWVRGTESTVWESSCGSGSSAAAVLMARGERDGVIRRRFTEPGGVLETAVTLINGAAVACVMGGALEMSAELTARIIDR